MTANDVNDNGALKAWQDLDGTEECICQPLPCVLAVSAMQSES